MKKKKKKKNKTFQHGHVYIKGGQVKPHLTCIRNRINVFHLETRRGGRAPERNKTTTIKKTDRWGGDGVYIGFRWCSTMGGSRPQQYRLGCVFRLRESASSVYRNPTKSHNKSWNCCFLFFFFFLFFSCFFHDENGRVSNMTASLTKWDESYYRFGGIEFWYT